MQIRTLSQHSWAEASNIFQYKKEENVPKPLKRSISRISALLETVDLEYERLLEERGFYKEEIRLSTDNNATLNVDLLEEVLNTKLPIGHKVDADDYSQLLDNLNVLGFSTVQSLLELIDAYLEPVLIENRRVSDGFKKLLQANPKIDHFENYTIREDALQKVKAGFYFSQTGLIRQILNLKLGKSWYLVYNEKMKNVG